MNIKDKNILIMGLGISGVSTAKALYSLGAKISILDAKTEEQLSSYINELKDINVSYFLASNEMELNNIDLIIKSPGIPLDLPILKKAEALGIEIITDIELANRISNNSMIAITGTNGKTTTTTLIGEIIKKTGTNCHVTGNIGVGILWETVNSKTDDIFVVEASSFQLESTKLFKPNISLIINITPDHIKWHRTFENYVKSKKKIYINQDKNDYTVLNYDDPILREIGDVIDSQIIFFSQRNILSKGVYLQDDIIVINDGKSIIPIMSYREIKIPGRHNLENALAAVSVGWALGIDIDIIVQTLKEFEGVEHRLEYVDTIDGISFYNDSKGTNPNASIKAIEALEKPIILIAGGYDKGSEFDEFIRKFNGKVHSLILLGETANKIKNTAISMGFSNIYIVGTMKEAVQKSYEIGNKNFKVLLSPACASWDMYNNYEIRGKDFKQSVASLRRLKNGQKES